MASVAQIQADVDSQLTTLLPALESAQAANLAGEGRYLQLLDSYSEPPDDDKPKKPPDNLNIKPEKVKKSWLDTGVDISALPCSLKCDEYKHPLGPGRVYVATFAKSNTIWRRCINFGPAIEFNQPWAIVPPVEELH